MVSFAYPILLYLLLLIPIIVLLHLWAKIAQRKRLLRFGRIDILSKLMPDASKYKSWVKLSFQLFALAAIIIVLARPRAGAKEETSTVKGIEVMIALDVSNSMLASSNDDPNGISRLDRAKYLLEKLIDKLSNDKIGLIVFAGEAYTQLPITSDFVSAKMFLNSINTEMVPTQGTAIGSAISMATNSFTPDETTQKAIIVITDGENHEDDAVQMAKTAFENGVTVHVLGVGTPQGSPIPVEGTGNFRRDKDGNIVVTKLNETMCQEIAQAGGGMYVRADNAASAVRSLSSELNKMNKTDIEEMIYSEYNEQYAVIGWIVFVLLLLEVILSERKNPLFKNIKLF